MFKLIIGDKATSTWSMRPWLVLKHAQIPFEEIEINQRLATFKHDIIPHSPSKKVPALWDGDFVIWDSLAIVEYLAEKYPNLWPKDPKIRAIARSVTSEMHSGFLPLRRNLPMDLINANLSFESTPDIAQDIARITDLWEKAEGPFLFGEWSIADAFFTPVATRFKTYEVALTGNALRYQQTLLATPEAIEWIAAAQNKK
jgi:glutathione S-transferase